MNSLFSLPTDVHTEYNIKKQKNCKVKDFLMWPTCRGGSPLQGLERTCLVRKLGFFTAASKDNSEKTSP